MKIINNNICRETKTNKIRHYKRCVYFSKYLIPKFLNYSLYLFWIFIYLLRQGLSAAFEGKNMLFVNMLKCLYCIHACDSEKKIYLELKYCKLSEEKWRKLLLFYCRLCKQEFRTNHYCMVMRPSFCRAPNICTCL